MYKEVYAYIYIYRCLRKRHKRVIKKMGNICSVSPSPSSSDDDDGNRGLNNTSSSSRSRKLMAKRSHLSSRKRDSMGSSSPGLLFSSSSSSLSPSSVLDNGDGDDEDSVWRRSILMGEKCEPPVFSGLILYDENGNHVEHLPLKSPTRPYPFTLPAVVA